MDVDSEEQSSERAELHFLAALVDELMKAIGNGFRGMSAFDPKQTLADRVSLRPKSVKRRANEVHSAPSSRFI